MAAYVSEPLGDKQFRNVLSLPGAVFQYQPTLAVQVLRRAGNQRGEILKTGGPAGQCPERFMSQRGIAECRVSRRHVRRIARDQIESLASEGPKPIPG